MLLIVGSLVPISLFILGYFVRFKKASFLIAGYNTASKYEKKKYDEDALCKDVGNLLFILGIILLLPPIGGTIYPDKISLFSNISTLLSVVSSIVAVIYMNTGNRYKKH